MNPEVEELVLVPNLGDARDMPFTVTQNEWLTALRLAALGGYTGVDASGAPNREAAAWFKGAVAKGLECDTLSDPDLVERVKALVAFCAGPGRSGFLIVR